MCRRIYSASILVDFSLPVDRLRLGTCWTRKQSVGHPTSTCFVIFLLCELFLWVDQGIVKRPSPSLHLFFLTPSLCPYSSFLFWLSLSLSPSCLSLPPFHHPSLLPPADGVFSFLDTYEEKSLGLKVSDYEANEEKKGKEKTLQEVCNSLKHQAIGGGVNLASVTLNRTSTPAVTECK